MYPLSKLKGRRGMPIDMNSHIYTLTKHMHHVNELVHHSKPGENSKQEIAQKFIKGLGRVKFRKN